MISLDTDKRKLQVLLALAVTTTECPVLIGYEETNKSTGAKSPKTASGITTGLTAIDIIPAPSSSVIRRITSMTIFNADTVAVTATVRMSDLATGSAVTRIITTVALQPGETLCYDESTGFYCLDVNGNRKTNATGTSSATSDALSAGVSGGTRASVALSTTVSASTVVSSTESLRTSAGWSVSISKVKSSFSF